MKRIIYILFFFLSFFQLSAQKEAYNWYFGNTAGLSFSSGGSSVIALNDGRLTAREGCTAISDSIGNLLFYSNGSTVWDRNHNVMSNGSGLNGSDDASQSSIIIPNPQRNGIYYIFTINSNSRVLYYSTVDMSLSNGLGGISAKNISLINPVAEKLTAALSTNGSDFYVAVHGIGNNDFYSFLVNSSGVQTTPVRTSIGTSHNNTLSNAKGQMKLSPDGQTIAVTIPDEEIVEIFGFNTGSGLVFNPISISLAGINPYGIEFSPNSEKLYVSSGSELYQFDISVRNSNVINNSRTLLGNADDLIHQLQLAPDGKIYIASNNRQTLGRIENPNASGSLAGYKVSALSLAGRTSNKGLPTFVQSFFTFIFTQSIITVCEGANIELRCSLSRNSASAYYIWEGPDGFYSDEQNPVILNVRKKNEGYYKVRVTLGSLTFEDSTYVKINSAPLTRIIPDGSTVICFGDSLTLFAIPDSSNYNYTWSTGERSSRITVKQAGAYTLTTESDGCVSYDTINITVAPSFTPEIRTIGPKVICEGDSLLLEAFPNNDINSYYWSTGDTTQSIMIKKGGTYTVTIDRNGCLRTANIFILNLEKPDTRIKALGPTSFCTGDSTILAAEPLDPQHSVLWSTGETTPYIIVKETGTITLEIISRNGCSYKDSIEITTGDTLNVRIRKNSDTLCEGSEIILRAEPFSTEYEYNWSTGETTPSIIIEKSGNYSVHVSAKGGCEGRDSVQIYFAPSPKAEIAQGVNATICNGDSLMLSPREYNPNNIYEWSTGETSPNIFVRNSGTYTLLVANQYGCSDTASFELTVNPSPTVTIDIIQNDILCKGDSVLLIAQTNKENFIKWSTGETSDTIVVKQSGIYSIEVENNSNCFAYDSIIVSFNPHPEPEILSDNGFTICPGEQLELRSKHIYYKYLWNTGDTSSSIIVNSAGMYVLTVFDTNNCESSTFVEIKEGSNKITGIDSISFGQVNIFNSKTISFSFQNLSDDTMTISDILLLRNNNAFNLAGPIDTIKLGYGDEYTADLEFKPEELTYYSDSLIIVIEHPCKEDLVFKIEGYGSGKGGLGIPDTSGIIGEKNFRIPIRARIKLYDSGLLKFTYSAKIRFYADIFLPEIVTNGIIVNDTIINNERILSVVDSNVVLSEGESIITEIVGTILLGEHKKTKIEILDFKHDNPFVEFEIGNGSLEAIGVCIQDASIVKIENGATLSITPNPAEDEINITLINVTEGSYHLRIFNTNGMELESRELIIESNKKQIKCDLRNYPSGTYVLSIKSFGYEFNKLFKVIK